MRCSSRSRKSGARSPCCMRCLTHQVSAQGDMAKEFAGDGGLHQDAKRIGGELQCPANVVQQGPGQYQVTIQRWFNALILLSGNDRTAGYTIW